MGLAPEAGKARDNGEVDREVGDVVGGLVWRGGGRGESCLSVGGLVDRLKEGDFWRPSS